jgi:hypothetical protein
MDGHDLGAEHVGEAHSPAQGLLRRGGSIDAHHDPGAFLATSVPARGRWCQGRRSHAWRRRPRGRRRRPRRPRPPGSLESHPREMGTFITGGFFSWVAMGARTSRIPSL